MRKLGLVLLALMTPGRAELIVVHLLDQAGVADVEKWKAVAEARRVLQEAGVETSWVDEALATKGPFNPERRSTDVFLRLHDKASAERLAPRGTVFGFAQPVGPGHFRWLASVFTHRAHQIAKDTGLGGVLGAMMAHEIGHLLLGMDAHTASGIMKSPWDIAEMRLVGQGRMLFDKGQAARMGENVRARASVW